MNLLRELQDWVGEHERQGMGSKALRVYTKCMLRNKIELAIKIKMKYGYNLPKSDMETAFSFALLAARRDQATKNV